MLESFIGSELVLALAVFCGFILSAFVVYSFGSEWVVYWFGFENG